MIQCPANQPTPPTDNSSKSVRVQVGLSFSIAEGSNDEHTFVVTLQPGDMPGQILHSN